MAKICQREGCERGTYGELCLMHKPRTAIKVNKPLPRSTKRIKQQGKIAKQWAATRAQWFNDNPADFYVCYLCGKQIPKPETTLDHKIPRSRAPHLRFDPANLAPCCWSCNSLKGSSVLDSDTVRPRP